MPNLPSMNSDNLGDLMHIRMETLAVAGRQVAASIGEKVDG